MQPCKTCEVLLWPSSGALVPKQMLSVHTIIL
jgi:hypothetical protein